MKYILSILGIAVICCGIFFCTNKKTEDQPLRIRIIANSCSKQDEQIKYNVKDAVVDYLEPILQNAKSKDEAKEIVSANKVQIENIVKITINKSNESYGAKVDIVRETLPMRAYADVSYAAGSYDTLKIELGDAKGDNWWCVVYPTVCFVK